MARNSRSTLPLVFGFAVIALLAGCDSDRTLAPSDQADLAARNSGNGPNISAPSNPVATAAAWNQVNVSWQDNSSNEAGFEVHRSTSGPSGVFSLLARPSANVTSYGNSGLSGSTQYCYIVRAFRKTGNNTIYSAFSNAACATTLAPPVPAAPSGVTATPRDGYISISWIDNSVDETGFRVERAGTSVGPWTALGTTGPNATASYAFGIAVEQQSCYRVFAVNSYGDSGPSNVDCTAIPAAPTNLAASLPGDGSVDLTWRDNSAVEDGFEVWRGDGVGSSVIATLPPNATGYHDVGVAPDNTYRYWVLATKDAGSSGNSNIVQVVVASSPPIAPANVLAVPYSSSSVGVYWLDQSANEEGFRIERSTDGGATWINAGTAGIDQAGFGDGGLPSEQPVCYRVIAFNHLGDSPPSNTGCTTPPAAPTDFTVTAVDEATVDFAWTDNSAVEDGYEVWVDDGYGNEYAIASGGPNTTSIRYQDPYVYNYYFYFVVALKDGGYSDASWAYPPSPPAGSAGLRLSPRSASGVPAPHPLIKRRVKP